jgi:hypothetical protein
VSGFENLHHNSLKRLYTWDVILSSAMFYAAFEALVPLYCMGHLIPEEKHQSIRKDETGFDKRAEGAVMVQRLYCV